MVLKKPRQGSKKYWPRHRRKINKFSPLLPSRPTPWLVKMPVSSKGLWPRPWPRPASLNKKATCRICRKTSRDWLKRKLHGKTKKRPKQHHRSKPRKRRLKILESPYSCRVSSNALKPESLEKYVWWRCHYPPLDSGYQNLTVFTSMIFWTLNSTWMISKGH